jgi:hypothetical protein
MSIEIMGEKGGKVRYKPIPAMRQSETGGGKAAAFHPSEMGRSLGARNLKGRGFS